MSFYLQKYKKIKTQTLNHPPKLGWKHRNISTFFLLQKGEDMKQNYHVNANTNSHSRAIIRCANTSNIDLARRFGVSTKTISKWRGRDFVKDKTSRPKTMHYALSETERELI